jgi:hypothetical protein
MNWLIAFGIGLALGFAAGYGVREWRSRMRRRRYKRLPPTLTQEEIEEQREYMRSLSKKRDE